MFKQISELLKVFVAPRDEWKIKLFENWDKIIGNLKGKVFILKAENNLLVLGVLHPALAQELFFLSDIFKKRINSLFGKEQIKVIQFRVIKREVKANFFQKKTQYKVQENEKACLNKNEYVNLKKIKDAELRECLKEFYLKRKRCFK